MAHRVDTITQHVFAFEDWEVDSIIKGLRELGNDDLADEIKAEMNARNCDDCQPVPAACEASPTCEKFYCDLVESLVNSLCDASKNGSLNVVRWW